MFAGAGFLTYYGDDDANHLPASVEGGDVHVLGHGAVLIGRKAIEAYVDGTAGRLMRSLKSVLGTALIEETTRLGRERIRFRDVIANYLGAVKRRAEQATGRELRD